MQIAVARPERPVALLRTQRMLGHVDKGGSVEVGEAVERSSRVRWARNRLRRHC